jgi:hypothetical protein
MPCDCSGYPDPFPTKRDLTQMLCYVVTGLRQGMTLNSLVAGNPVFAGWLLDHDKADAERIAEENRRDGIAKARKAALSKLTAQERAALGIHDIDGHFDPFSKD